jgi:predicted DNA-binding transcriptional regulator AlpA
MQPQALPPHGFSRVPAAARFAGVSDATYWRWARVGRAPAPVKLSPGVSAVRNAELLEWASDPEAWASRHMAGESAAA